MKYFKIFVMIIGYITMVTLFGEHIISKEVNGYLQLLSFVGLVGFTIGIINETVNTFKNKTK